MRNILITGGAGYVGSHCTKVLVDAGYNCVVYDNLSRGHSEFVKWCPLIVGDIRDHEKLKKIFFDNKFDAVMHFAALSYVGESILKPLEYWDNNFVGTKTLLESMLEADVNKIVFSSTCAVYGQPNAIPINENTIKSPINPYGYSKLACENLMDHLNDSAGLSSIRFRYFNASGSCYEEGIGEWHNPQTRLIPLAIKAAIDNSSLLNVFGSDFQTQDGFAIRDYVHVKDLAIAHLMGLEYLLCKGGTHVFNLGTGQGSSVKQIIDYVENETSRQVNYIVTERRPGDPAVLVADPSKVNKALSWKAKYSTQEIIYDALQWILISKNY